jgi:predicted Rdx family selenoprotein
VAALIKDSLGVETDLEPGGRGEFTVWVDGKKIVEKGRSGFPADSPLIQAVKTALALSGVEGLE